MLPEDIFSVFQFRMSSEKINAITDDQISATYDYIHKTYMDRIDQLGKKPASSEDSFSWFTKKLDINILYFKKNDEVVSFFFFSKSHEPGTIIFHDLINQRITYEDLALWGEEFLGALIEKDLITTDPQRILPAGILADGNLLKDIGRLFFDSEYRNHFQPLLQPPSKALNFNNIRIHKDIYDFEEMIKVINDAQFAFELEECLDAYENEKFFLCAAGLGSVLEHILYLSIEKSVPPQDIKTTESATASEYIGQLRKAPFNIDKREATHLKTIFAYRNSVSHFNKGIFSKEMCDNLLGGIKICFEKYYMHQPKPEIT